MDLKQAAAVAKQQVNNLLAPGIPQHVRLENFLYDDHLGVWTLTIGFVPPDADVAESPPRSRKIVRVSEANKSVLSVSDG